MTSPPAGWDAHVHVFDATAPVVAGHYRPAHRPLADIEAVSSCLDVGHLVIVQPSVYGTDPSVMLAALRAGAGRHRGIAVVDASIDDAALDALHAAGVRGIRFNRVSPVGHGGDPARDHAALAPRLAERGWHLQWYATARELGAIAALHDAPGPPAVLDHLGGVTPGLATADPAWEALARLADRGAWIKLSGWYRLEAPPPYDALHEAIGRVAGLFDDRLVWGSDWPHTSFAPGEAPDYASTFAPVVAALGAERARRVLQAGARLYG